MTNLGGIGFGSIATGMFMAAVASTSALAITDTDFTYSNPQRRALAIHQAAFAPHDSASAQNYSANNPNSYLRGDGCYSTPLNLPLGAKFKALRVRTLSTTAAGLPVFIHAQQVFNDLEAHVLNVDAGANVAGVSTNSTFAIPAAVPPVNDSTAFVLTVCLKPGQFFKGARVEYTVTNAGD